jgi:cyclopropane-fatty-acyl-phospholipid synthase
MNTLALLARVARPIVLQALDAWEIGRVTLHLPDGEVRSFGQPDAEPHSRVWIERDAFFAKFALQGDLGAGESYMDGDWRSDDLAQFAALVLRNRHRLALDSFLSRIINVGNDIRHWLRANTLAGSRRNIKEHYDLSNELFATFLDETMTYSSAVFESRDQSLADAQRNKYRILAEKAQIGPEDHVLEIGCGWGGFGIHAARTCGCRVTGITISERQHDLARRRVAEAGLADRVEIRLQDYRTLEGRFDKIVSIEMFEALGFENWGLFFRKCDDLLRPNGLVVLQAISIPDQRFAEYRKHADWIQRYIFPGSLLAAVGPLVGEATRSSTLLLNHLEDVGLHYAETLARWRRAFMGSLARVRELGFDARFVRMWEYYLAVCEAAFATRTLGDIQVVLTRPNNLALRGISARLKAAA